jgi:hypothetical protein
MDDLMKRILLLPLVAVLLLSSCLCKKRACDDNEKETKMKTAFALPDIVIYKTSADYSNNVPVILNDEKTKVMSFPAPKDVKIGDELATPLELENGFLLDRRGIGPNVAFTSYTYEEYAKLDKAPTPEDLFAKIIDNDPITELYTCGKTTNPDEDLKRLNEMILSGDFSACEKRN